MGAEMVWVEKGSLKRNVSEERRGMKGRVVRVRWERCKTMERGVEKGEERMDQRVPREGRER